MRIIKLFFVIILPMCLSHGYGQIVDDTTRLIYGPHSTQYITQEEIITNSQKLQNIDSTIGDVHNYDYVYKGRSVYQNLGNLGTPLNYIYFEPSQSIGRNLGFNSFTPYAFNPDEVKYYETRSPFTSLFYVQGTNGQQMADGAFSRNIKPNWNAGFDIKKMTSHKVIGAQNRRDPQVDHTSFLLYTRFFTKDSLYQVLANFTVLDHKNYETGGVVPNPGETLADLFDYRVENTWLYVARSYERRAAFHLYHQLQPFKSSALQLYHTFDYRSQSDRFNDVMQEAYYYQDNRRLTSNFDTVATTDRTDFRLFENKAGVKGLMKGLDYRVYFRRKDFVYQQYYYLNDKRNLSENFAGAVLGYKLPFFNTQAGLSGEYLISKDFQSTGQEPYNFRNDYRIRAELKSDFLTAGYYDVMYSPTLVQTRYIGNILWWDNERTFRNTHVNEFYARGSLKWKKLSIEPGVSYSLINDYIYYDTLALPAQFNGTIRYVSADLRLKLMWKNFHLDNFTRYAQASGILQVPTWYNHARAYYQRRLFQVLNMQLGLDLFWKPAYKPYNYMPVTQQFYLNNKFTTPEYLLADVFLNLQIRSATGFLKFSNVNQGFFAPGYFPTPYYPVMMRNFEFGIRWLFYD